VNQAYCFTRASLIICIFLVCKHSKINPSLQGCPVVRNEMYTKLYHSNHI
jgi:hypothetical protein